MNFAGLNYLAIPAAALVAWLLGAVWYNLLAAPWVRAQGKSMEAFRAEAAGPSGGAAFFPYLLAFVAELVMAWVLAGVLGHLGPGQVTIRSGVISAFFLWLGLVAPTLAVNNMFGMRRAMLTVIDGGHWLVVLLAMGAVIGAMGV